MSFKRGQVVKIIKVDPSDDPRWMGFEAEVADTYIGETSPHLVNGGANTKLLPMSARPDAKFPHVDPRGWFFWPTKDLELVRDEK